MYTVRKDKKKSLFFFFFSYKSISDTFSESDETKGSPSPSPTAPPPTLDHRNTYTSTASDSRPSLSCRQSKDCCATRGKKRHLFRVARARSGAAGGAGLGGRGGVGCSGWGRPRRRAGRSSFCL